MYDRLSMTARKAAGAQAAGPLFLDCYNRTFHADCAPTITTRIYACNHYYIMEKSTRQQEIRAHVLPGGNIRCYRDNERKSGISELQFTHPDNISPAVTTMNSIKVIDTPSPKIIARPHGY
ncbi:MAG: hypothetical protein IJ649_03180, partial [Oscillospiraceae bacterium]|nr:hypothetical protein [Oscillospiraceae bacterium]